jgi:hypothetical protein
MFFKPPIDPLIEMQMREIDKTLGRLRAKLADVPAARVGDDWPAHESMAEYVRRRRMHPAAALFVLTGAEMIADASHEFLEDHYSRFMIERLSDQEGADV